MARLHAPGRDLWLARRVPGQPWFERYRGYARPGHRQPHARRVRRDHRACPSHRPRAIVRPADTPMNTGNGGTEGRVAQRLEGTIDGANPRGIRLAGEADWRNCSRWADKPASAPARGARVRLALDASGFVRSVQIVGKPPTAGAPAADRDRTISRLAVLKAAATFLGHLGQVREEVRSEE